MNPRRLRGRCSALSPGGEATQPRVQAERAKFTISSPKKSGQKGWAGQKAGNALSRCPLPVFAPSGKVRAELWDFQPAAPRLQLHPLQRRPRRAKPPCKTPSPRGEKQRLLRVLSKRLGGRGAAFFEGKSLFFLLPARTGSVRNATDGSKEDFWHFCVFALRRPHGFLTIFVHSVAAAPGDVQTQDFGWGSPSCPSHLPNLGCSRLSRSEAF